MFKKTKRKIVASILIILVLILSGTLCVIYIASYVDMTNENSRLLSQYVESYTISEEDFTETTAGELEQNPANDPGRHPVQQPMLELSTFYSVVISQDGTVLKVDTADISTLDEDTLSELALQITQNGKESGVTSNLAYRMADKGDYILVAFIDNTLILESAGTFMTYTLIFGAVALVFLFFLSNYIAKKIVAPLEESYNREKQFVSDAGHELKTPVAVINANLDILSQEIGENQWLANIQYENERMSALIIQLLELARAENAKVQKEPLDFSRLVAGEMLPFESVAFESNKKLISDLEPEITVNGNGVQLKQLVSVLIDNALHHSTGQEISVSLKRSKSSAVFSVSNDGEEIPEEDRKKLFKRFYRTDSARSSAGGHYGLGLAIAKTIASAHKGDIEVSCGGGKVIFTVKLPLYKEKK